MLLLTLHYKTDTWRQLAFSHAPNNGKWRGVTVPSRYHKNSAFFIAVQFSLLTPTWCRRDWRMHTAASRKWEEPQKVDALATTFGKWWPLIDSPVFTFRGRSYTVAVITFSLSSYKWTPADMTVILFVCKEGLVQCIPDRPGLNTIIISLLFMYTDMTRQL